MARGSGLLSYNNLECARTCCGTPAAFDENMKRPVVNRLMRTSDPAMKIVAIEILEKASGTLMTAPPSGVT